MVIGVTTVIDAPQILRKRRPDNPALELRGLSSIPTPFLRSSLRSSLPRRSTTLQPAYQMCNVRDPGFPTDRAIRARHLCGPAPNAFSRERALLCFVSFA